MTIVGNNGGYLPGSANALRQPIGASDAPVPGSGSPSTSYLPAAGVQSGAATGGGITDGNFPGGAVVGAARGVANAGAAVGADQLQEQTVPVDMAASSPAQVAGPPAWNSAWAQKFLDAGVDRASVQQFTMTGANGADAATLQAALDQVEASSKKELEQFAAEHPEEYKDLRSIKAYTKAELVQTAMMSNAGKLPKETLAEVVSTARSGNDILGTTAKSMLPYMFIPAWGAVRFALSPLFGGKDPISGEKIKLDFWNNGMVGWFDALGAVAGAVTISNYARVASTVSAGHRAIAEGGTAAKIAAAQGVENLTGWNKALSYLPYSNSGKAVSALAHVKDIEAGAKALPVGSQVRKLVEDQLAAATRGEVRLSGMNAQKLGFGFQTDTRGFIMGRGKELTGTSLTGRSPEILIDSYLKGKSSMAHFAAAATDYADEATKGALKAEVTAGMGGAELKVKAMDRAMRGQMLGNASKELADVNYIQKPTSLLGKLRPGGMEDAFRAIDNLGTKKIGMGRGIGPMFKALPTLGKVGVIGGIGAAVAGGGYLFLVKPQLEAQAKAAAAAAEGGGATAEGGGATQADQMTPELQAGLQQLAQATPAVQKQELEAMKSAITQLTALSSRTPEQEQQLQQASYILPLMVQAVSGAQGQQQGGQAQAQAQTQTQTQAPQRQSQPIGATD